MIKRNIEATFFAILISYLKNAINYKYAPFEAKKAMLILNCCFLLLKQLRALIFKNSYHIRRFVDLITFFIVQCMYNLLLDYQKIHTFKMRFN